MAKVAKRREWTKDDVRELKNSCSSKNTCKKDREGAQKDSRRYTAESVHAWRILGFAAVA